MLRFSLLGKIGSFKPMDTASVYGTESRIFLNSRVIWNARDQLFSHYRRAYAAIKRKRTLC